MRDLRLRKYYRCFCASKMGLRSLIVIDWTAASARHLFDLDKPFSTLKIRLDNCCVALTFRFKKMCCDCNADRFD